MAPLMEVTEALPIYACTSLSTVLLAMETPMEAPAKPKASEPEPTSEVIVGLSTAEMPTAPLAVTELPSPT